MDKIIIERHPSKIDEDGKRHYPIRAIPYQDPQQEAERLKAVHEAQGQDRPQGLSSSRRHSCSAVFSSPHVQLRRRPVARPEANLRCRAHPIRPPSDRKPLRKSSTGSQPQVPTASLVKVYTEDDDPNKLLGRPNGYTSKIAFADSRISKADIEGAEEDAIERGGSIEVFPDAELAKGRAEYIQGALKNSGLGAEYDDVHGPVLVRVTGNLSPAKPETTRRRSADERPAAPSWDILRGMVTA